MTLFEQVNKILATLIGIISLIAPIVSVVFQSKRPKGRSVGKGAASRTWFSVFVISVGFIGVGVLLWHPIPLAISGGFSLLLSVLGTGFYYSGTGVYLWGLATLRSQFGVSGISGAELYQEHKLITNGPFVIIRHPMYAGVLLAAFGALLIFRTWAMAVFAPISLVVISRAEREEELLAQEFGSHWEIYAANVPKWLPNLPMKK